MAQPAIRESFDLAVQHHQAGNLREAESLYRQILAANPDFADALHLLGVIAVQSGNLSAGVELIRQAIAIQPGVPDYFSNLAAALTRQRRYPEAIDAFQQQLKLQPGNASICVKLAEVLWLVGNASEARAATDRALQLRPGFAEAENTLGTILYQSSDFESARAAFQRALAANPDWILPHLNLAKLLLLLGEFARGWMEQEWRCKTPELATLHQQLARPRWTGEALAGQTILLYTEQGFGDALQFVRYVPLVKLRGGKVVLVCRQPLRSLLERIDDVEQIVTEGQPLPHFDVHCPLMSLPAVFSTTPASIPATVPYLSSEPASVDAWRHRMSKNSDSSLKVGLVWAGAEGHTNDANRSMALEMFSSLLKMPGVRWFSLQKGNGATQVADYKDSVVELGSQLQDFSDTAAVLKNLDLLISVDTSVAHLAGALGVPVWVLLPYLPDWRWMLNRDDSPWYPTMRLFRQTQPRDWESVIQRVHEAIMALQAASGLTC